MSDSTKAKVWKKEDGFWYFMATIDQVVRKAEKISESTASATKRRAILRIPYTTDQEDAQKVADSEVATLETGGFTEHAWEVVSNDRKATHVEWEYACTGDKFKSSGVIRSTPMVPEGKGWELISTSIKDNAGEDSGPFYLLWQWRRAKP